MFFVLSSHGGMPCNLIDLLEKDQKGTEPTPFPTPPPVSREDPSNQKFCGKSWDLARDNCSLESHCPNGECPEGYICYGGINTCNAYDMTKAPTSHPTLKPTGSPTLRPVGPTESPSEGPPTMRPSFSPIVPPTNAPTVSQYPTEPPVIPADDMRHSYWCGKVRYLHHCDLSSSP